MAAKSPLTGLFFDSTFGGRFPATLKRTGFDAVVITGRAAGARPTSRSTEHGRRAEAGRAQLWGRTTRETVTALLEVEGGDADAMAIGPAGERRVRFAAMAPLLEEPRGRGGARGHRRGARQQERQGAWWCAGARKTEIADPAALKALLEETREPLTTGTKALTTFGTPFLVGPSTRSGALGSYNLRQRDLRRGAGRSPARRCRRTTTTATRRV